MAPEYAWLEKLTPLPRLVDEALKEIDVTEVPGKSNNPKIMKWAKEVGVTRMGYMYTGDDVPWCGLFMAAIALRAGKTVPKGPLYALNWSVFGTKTSDPVLGDVLVFKRNGGGHVGLYIAEDDSAYHVLGGNQSDKVCITRIAKTRLYTARRPIVKSVHSPVCKKYFVKPNGGLSANEA